MFVTIKLIRSNNSNNNNNNNSYSYCIIIFGGGLKNLQFELDSKFAVTIAIIIIISIIKFIFWLSFSSTDAKGVYMLLLVDNNIMKERKKTILCLNCREKTIYLIKY